MAYPKGLNVINQETQKRAIQSHLGFVRFVSTEINKVGIAKVLKCRSKGEGDYWWLFKAYERLLDFAEQFQLRLIPQKLEGEGFASHTHLTLIIPKDLEDAASKREQILS